MMIYGRLCRFLPGPVAGVLSAIWLAALVVLCVLFLDLEPAPFRYAAY